MKPVELGIYIPQVALDFDALLSRARTCEELGFSFWLYDHLYTPGLPDQPALEGWTLATALLAQTTTLHVGHLVLNNNFRHPALLARMATTLALISGSRLELGLRQRVVRARTRRRRIPVGLDQRAKPAAGREPGDPHGDVRQ